MSTIRSEIRQRRPFPSRQQETAVALLRTADIVRRIVGAVIEPSGITLQQYNVLRILRGAGEGAMPTLEIAERIIEQTPGITRLLDRLEARQLVRRERCASDRRQILCRLTPAGLELVNSLDVPVDEANRRAFAGLNRPELLTLISLMDKLRARYAAERTP